METTPPIQNEASEEVQKKSLTEIAMRANKRRNWRIFAAFLFAAFGGITVGIMSLAREFETISRYQYVLWTITAYASILCGIGIGLFAYLETTTFTLYKNLIDETDDRKIQGNKNLKFTQPVPATINNQEPSTDPNSTNAKKSQGYTAVMQIEAQSKIDLINEDLNNTTRRLENEIARLQKSANLNLIFGSLNTIAAIIFLAMQVYFSVAIKDEKTDLPTLLAHYIPRLSLVIFIEIFAFFFLKIYKANLMDIKYFHNERTNVEQKILALKMASLSPDPKIAEHVIKQLANVERNIILKKGETTIELERERLDSKNDKDILEALKSLLHLKSGEKTTG